VFSAAGAKGQKDDGKAQRKTSAAPYQFLGLRQGFLPLQGEILFL
jgi:hypothetical protein